MSRRYNLRQRIRPCEQRKTQIQTYFESDGRFELEERHGKGGQSSIHKVKYAKAGESGPISKCLVLKLADPERNSDVRGLKYEKVILQRLLGCKHIVRMRTIVDDPLAAADDLGWAWIYLESLENGTLGNLMKRVKSAGFATLPNRLLWLIFMCMIRACIAMAWPLRAPDDNETTAGKPANTTGITHNDVHSYNFMFGSFADSPEHNISPVLKLIDFGQSQVWDKPHDSGATAEQWNIEDIGLMMAAVIKLQTDMRYTGEEIEVDLTQLGRPKDVLSPASGILPDPTVSSSNNSSNSLPEDPCPRVDLDLRRIVAACMAPDPTQRPTLAELEQWVFGKISNASPAPYGTLPGGASWEADEVVQRLIRACMVDASLDSDRDSQMSGT